MGDGQAPQLGMTGGWPARASRRTPPGRRSRLRDAGRGDGGAFGPLSAATRWPPADESSPGGYRTGRRTFADRLADRQSVTIPSEDADYGDLGQAFPSWATDRSRGRDPARLTRQTSAQARITASVYWSVVRSSSPRSCTWRRWRWPGAGFTGARWRSRRPRPCLSRGPRDAAVCGSISRSSRPGWTAMSPGSPKRWTCYWPPCPAARPGALRVSLTRWLHQQWNAAVL